MVADSPPPPPLPLPPRPPPPLLPPPLSNQPQPHSPNLSSARRIPAFLAFLAFLAAGAGGAATVALCHSGLDHRVGGKESTELVVRGERKRVPQEFVDELASFLVENLTVDYEERCFHGKPQNSFHRAVNVPDVIVFPRSQDEVQKIVMTCNKYEVAMCNFQTIKDAADVAIAMMLSGIQVLRVELLDGVQIRAINMANG